MKVLRGCATCIRSLIRFFSATKNQNYGAQNFLVYPNQEFKVCHLWAQYWWVSSTPFQVPFHVLVHFRNRGISSTIICKWSVQKTFQQHFSIFSKSVCCGFYLKRNVAFTLISFAVLKWWIVYQFNYQLSYRFNYRFSYQFSCFLS